VRATKVRFLFFLLLSGSAVSFCSASSIIYVDASGPNEPGTGAYTDPFRRIQQGIDAAVDGDTVEVRSGLYTGAGNINLDPNGASITIRSTEPNDANVVSETIIDAAGAGRGFYIHSGEDANCIIAGFTITDGNTYPAIGFNGGNIYCYFSGPTIRNCVIKNGHAAGSGGGMYIDVSNPKVIGCRIEGNTADYYGGAASFVRGKAELVGCVITGNSALLEGGGLDCGEGNPTFVNCIISDNHATRGGGVNCYSFEPNEASLVNCTISGNSAGEFGGGLCCQYTGSARVRNSILWANQSSNGKEIALIGAAAASVGYCDVEGGLLGVYDPCDTIIWQGGNIDSDPCFASFDAGGGASFWDFHLKSEYGRWKFYRVDFDGDGIVNLVDFDRLALDWQNSGSGLEADLNRDGIVDGFDIELFSGFYLSSGCGGEWLLDAVTSSCVDAGDPGSGWSKEPWPNGKRVNMGAYGGTGRASKNGNIADFDVSGIVDFVDFSDFARRWQEQDVCIEDLDKDGVVGFLDLEIFTDNWLWERQ